MWCGAPAWHHASHHSAIGSSSWRKSVCGAEIGRGGKGRNSPSEITNRHWFSPIVTRARLVTGPGLVGELEAGPEAVDALVVDRVLDLGLARACRGPGCRGRRGENITALLSKSMT